MAAIEVEHSNDEVLGRRQFSMFVSGKMRDCAVMVKKANPNSAIEEYNVLFDNEAAILR